MLRIIDKVLEPSKIFTGSKFVLKVKVEKHLTFNELENYTFNELENYTFNELEGE